MCIPRGCPSSASLENDGELSQDEEEVARLAQRVLEMNPRATKRLLSALRLLAGGGGSGPHHYSTSPHAMKPRRAGRELQCLVRRPLAPALQLHELTGRDPREADLGKQAMELYGFCFPGDDEFPSEQICALVKAGAYRMFILTKTDLTTAGKTFNTSHKPSSSAASSGFSASDCNVTKQVAGIMLVLPYQVETSQALNLDYCAISEHLRGGGVGAMMVRLLHQQLEREANCRMENAVSPAPITSQMTGPCLQPSPETTTAVRYTVDQAAAGAQLLTLECRAALVAFYKRHIPACYETSLKPAVFQQLNPKTNKLEPTPLHFLVAPLTNDSSHLSSLVGSDSSLRALRAALLRRQTKLRLLYGANASSPESLEVTTS